MPETPAYIPFSQITVDDVLDYMRVTETTEKEKSQLSTMLEAAKSFVLSQTGRTEAQADTLPELTIAVYAVSSDMFDKRAFNVDEKNANKIVESILGARNINLL